jgi:hypothetical protein
MLIGSYDLTADTRETLEELINWDARTLAWPERWLIARVVAVEQVQRY